VALLGTADESAKFDTSGGWTNQSSRVQAVVDMFGPADFSARVGRPNKRLDEQVFDVGNKGEGALKLASPVHYVSKGDAPFLILHGDKDELVPLEQSERLLAALKKNEVPAKLEVVKNAAHGFAPNGGTPDPSRAELATMIADFFDEHLQANR
jgi:dipeptidyl aminopeptidase/acylaminoacyl peptidase